MRHLVLQGQQLQAAQSKKPSDACLAGVHGRDAQVLRRVTVCSKIGVLGLRWHFARAWREGLRPVAYTVEQRYGSNPDCEVTESSAGLEESFNSLLAQQSRWHLIRRPQSSTSPFDAGVASLIELCSRICKSLIDRVPRGFRRRLASHGSFRHD